MSLSSSFPEVLSKISIYTNRKFIHRDLRVCWMVVMEVVMVVLLVVLVVVVLLMLLF